MKFLIVDDSPTARRIITGTLKAFGYDDIIEAEDGDEAYAKLKAFDIDIIITDIVMPKMNGIELIKLIKSQEIYTEIPIVIISTKGKKEDISDALALGIDDYIVKPFVPSILKKKLDPVIEKVKDKKVVQKPRNIKIDVTINKDHIVDFKDIELMFTIKEFGQELHNIATYLEGNQPKKSSFQIINKIIFEDGKLNISSELYNADGIPVSTAKSRNV